MNRNGTHVQNLTSHGWSLSTSPLALARGVITALTALAVGLAYLAAASAAHAMPAPDPPYGGSVPLKPPTPEPVIRVVHLGAPLWMFVLVAAISIALTAATALAISRLRHGTPAAASPA